MSSYSIQEPNEEIIFMVNGNIVDCNYKLYSKLQNKRFLKVLSQLKSNWYDVYTQITFLREHSNISNIECNEIMLKIHKLFIITHNDKIDYYNNEKMNLRKNKNFLSKKINKLRNSKNKL